MLGPVQIYCESKIFALEFWGPWQQIWYAWHYFHVEGYVFFFCHNHSVKHFLSDFWVYQGTVDFWQVQVECTTGHFPRVKGHEQDVSYQLNGFLHRPQGFWPSLSVFVLLQQSLEAHLETPMFIDVSACQIPCFVVRFCVLLLPLCIFLSSLFNVKKNKKSSATSNC